MATRKRNNAGAQSPATAAEGRSTKRGSPPTKRSTTTPLWRYAALSIAALSLGWLGYSHYRHYTTLSPRQQKSAVPAAPEDNAAQILEKQWSSFSPRPALPFVLDPRKKPTRPVRTADEDKRDAVKAAFTSSWAAYVNEAWGADEYHPLSHTGSNLSMDGGIGYTIIDTIDTLLIFGEQSEYNRARDWVKANLHGGLEKWERRGKFNVFETVIRTLGGLLSAYALCTERPSNVEGVISTFYTMCDPGDAQMYLETAQQLSHQLHPAFDTPTGIPKREVDFYTGQAFSDMDNNGAASLAEATTVQMEFKYLSFLTQDKGLWALAERPMRAVRRAMRMGTHDGLLPIFLSPENGQFYLSAVRLGSRGDSYFEYLIKQYVQTNRSEEVYRDMFDRSMTGVKKHMVQQSISTQPPFLFTAEIIPRVLGKGEKPVLKLLPKQDHLVCFLAGALMLGAHDYGVSLAGQSALDSRSVNQEDWALGHELLRGCMTTYQETSTGLSPEISFWRTPGEAQAKEEDWYIKQARPNADGKSTPLIDARNILRPETVESLFVAFHLSGDPVYREWGWEIFQAFEKHCKLPNGAYAGIKDVDADLDDIAHEDKMETFWLSETLKYLYLLFDDQSTLPLSQWVLNTEAHPLPIFRPTEMTGLR